MGGGICLPGNPPSAHTCLYGTKVLSREAEYRSLSDGFKYISHSVRTTCLAQQTQLKAEVDTPAATTTSLWMMEHSSRCYLDLRHVYQDA